MARIGKASLRRRMNWVTITLTTSASRMINVVKTCVVLSTLYRLYW
jgi:hypothetical protein